MARSWQYPRWRRIVLQVILWVILGGTLAVAQLVVRHRQLIGSVELADALAVDLPGGVVASVRLPKGWPVEHDPAEHRPDAAVQSFQAHEAVTAADTEPFPTERMLQVDFEPAPDGATAREFLDASGKVEGGLELPSETGGRGMLVAEVEGYARLGRTPGPNAARVYAAVGIVPAGPSTPTPVAVTVLLYCAPTDADDRGDRDLLRRVSAAITVRRDRAPAVPSIHPEPSVP